MSPPFHLTALGVSLALAVTSLPGTVQARPGAKSQADAVLADIIKRDGGPGVMAAVMRDGKLLWSGAAGRADLEASVPLTSRTRMRVGSVSKPLTTMMTLRLAEQGKLDLDADIHPLVPELAAPVRGVITARMLGSHTAGVRQYDFKNYLEANNVFYHATLAEAVKKVAGGALTGSPGEAYGYSSIGFNILGLVDERAGGADFAALMAREVAGPLKLGDTVIDHPLEIIPRRTRFYTRFPDGAVRNTIWRDSSDYYPSGGMLSTAEDLARFTWAVFEGKWLGAKSMRTVLTEAKTRDGKAVPYSFGWQVVRGVDGAVAYYGHGGETNGANAVVRYYPADGLVVAAIINANSMGGRPYFFEAVTERIPALFRSARPAIAGKAPKA
ncbi:MAG: serine hydrolase domain-containing protein [Caulobacteraceae bacterium]